MMLKLGLCHDTFALVQRIYTVPLMLVLFGCFGATACQKTDALHEIQELTQKTDLGDQALPARRHRIPDNLSKYALLYEKANQPAARFQHIDLYFNMPAELVEHARQGHSLAIYTGDLADVSELYLGDSYLGGRGNLNPYRPGAMRPLLRTIPPEHIDVDGQPEFRLRLSTRDYKFPLQIMQSFYVGTADAVYRQFLLQELTTVTFLAVYVIVAVYHLFLFWKRPQDRYYLHFAIFALIASSYWFVSDTAIRDLVFGDHVYLHRKLEHILLFFILPPFLFFLAHFFKDSYTRLSRIFLVLAIVLSLITFSGDVHWMRICARIWHASYLLITPFFLFYLGRELLNGNRDAIYLAVGITVLALAGVNDVLRSLTIIRTPRLANYSLFIFVIGLVGLMANRFVDATNHAERLLAHTTRLNLELIQKNIHPHFLMNSINSAINLVAEDPPKAEQLLLSLAEEIRETLQVSKQVFSSLDREIDLVHRHLKVMALRYEKNIQLDVQGDASGHTIPPLILLTIIENGLTHGLRGRDQIEFKLKISIHQNRLELVLWNNGDNSVHSSKGTGTGLRYVRSRLSEAFGTDWQFQHEPVDNGYQARLDIPLNMRGMRDRNFGQVVSDFANNKSD